MSNQNNETEIESTETLDQLEAVMMQGKAVADAARAAHPSVPFARLANMLQMAADWARQQAWCDECESGENRQKDADGEEVISLLRNRTEQQIGFMTMLGLAPAFLGFYGSNPVAELVRAAKEHDSTRRVADYIAGNLLTALEREAGIEIATIAAAFMADTAILGVTIRDPENAETILARVAEERASLAAALSKTAAELNDEESVESGPVVH
jgi:hypothetical protein